MAVTADKVVVELEAKLDRYNANVLRSERAFNSAMVGMTRSARSAEQSVIGSVRGIVGAYLGVQGARLAAQFVDASTRVTNSLKVVGLEGTALTRTYDTLFASAQKNFAPLETLTQLYTRLTLAQKDLGVTNQELLTFTDRIGLALRVQGTTAEEARGALIQLTQALGGGIVRAEEFNSIVEGAPTILRAAAAGITEAGGSVAKLRRLVIEGKISSEAFFRGFLAGSNELQKRVASAQITISQGFTLINNALIDAAGRINTGSAAGARLATTLRDVADAIKGADFGPLIDEINTFITDIKTAYDDLVTFIGAVERFRQVAADKLKGVLGASDAERIATAFERSEGSLKRLASVPSSTGGSAGGPSSRGGRGNAVSSDAVSINQFPVDPDSEKKKQNAYARELRQITERTALLKVELGTIGQSQFLRDKALATQELENAAIQAKIPLNETVRQQIEASATAYAEMADQVRQAEDKQQALNDLMQTFGDIAADTFIGLIDGTKSWNDALNETLKTLAKMFAQAAFTGGGPLGSLLGLGGEGGNVGGLFGLFGKRAGGGSVQQGQPYMVGEQGPELMIPGQSGRVVANHRLAGAMGGAMGGSGQIVMNNDFRGNDGSTRAYIDNRLALLEAQIAMTPQTTSESWRRNRPALNPAGA